MKKIIFLLLFLSMTSVSANQLKNHSSPYLAMHGNDPVNWVEWGSPALDKAKKENKLLFVSIGYFACHWCHVMQRESFADREVAEKINKNYVPVKVDRELNPVLDKRLIEFVQVTNGTAGWPLNVFVTPQGYPLVGATYVPRDHFLTILGQLDKKWNTEQATLVSQAKDISQTLTSMLQKQERSVVGKSITELADSYVDTAMEYADTLQGGFGQQRKFPQIPQLWALLKLNRSTKNKEADEFIQLTLDQMSKKGLHDELVGGFYRYTVDPSWEIPHFEKMLYTNAMISLLYFDAADQYNNNEYRKVALETLQFIRKYMRGSNNAYISSLSAVDDKNEEGGFYLWTQKELKKILNEKELKLANLYWNMDRANELPAGNLPRQNSSFTELSKRTNRTIQQVKRDVNGLKTKLASHRDKTRKLPRDTKLLAGMNGLVLSTFARGVKYDKSLLSSGKKLANFLTSLWRQGKSGKILHRSAADDNSGTLYDYAAVSWGLIKWADAIGDQKLKRIGNEMGQKAWQRFYINKSWLENPESLLPEGVKKSHIEDSALISAEALLLEASFISDDSSLVKRANSVLDIVTRTLETDIYSYASLLSVSQKDRP